MNQSSEPESTPQRSMELAECYFDLLAEGHAISAEDFCRPDEPNAEETRWLIGSARNYIAFVSCG